MEFRWRDHDENAAVLPNRKHAGSRAKSPAPRRDRQGPRDRLLTCLLEVLPHPRSITENFLAGFRVELYRLDV